LIDDLPFQGRNRPGWALIPNGPWRAGPKNLRLKTGRVGPEWTGPGCKFRPMQGSIPDTSTSLQIHM